MRRRTLAIIIAAVVVVAVLVVGVVRAGAQGTPNLPSITVGQLLQNVATKAHDTTALSGEFSWSNDLLGAGSLVSLGGSGGGGPSASLASVLNGGSGRVWLQDGKARIESQSDNGNGDVVAVTNGQTAWVWQAATNTATEYTLPSGAGATASPSPAPSFDPATAISRLIDRLAPTAKLEVSGQAVVAGQDTYTLTLTPTSPLTTFGSITVAIDGHHWVPLQVQVFAKGATKPVVSAGFTSVSYAPVSDGLFTFTPPSGATVVHKDLSNGLQGLRTPGAGQETPRIAGAKHVPLTLDQAKARAPFLLTPSSTPAGLDFKGAFVTPTGSGKQAHPPVAVLHYGTGFGSVFVVETPATAAQDKAVEQRLGQLSLLGKADVNGVPAIKLQTALGSALTFRQGDVRVVVAGIVPWSDLQQVAVGLQ